MSCSILIEPNEQRTPLCVLFWDGSSDALEIECIGDFDETMAIVQRYMHVVDGARVEREKRG